MPAKLDLSLYTISKLGYSILNDVKLLLYAEVQLALFPTICYVSPNQPKNLITP